jgi:hypothetical protein
VTDAHYHVFLVDGPLGGETFGLSLREGSKLPEHITFAPMPPDTPGIVAGNWAMVEWGKGPSYVFPGSAKYEFDPGASIMRAARGIVIYAHVEAE